MSIVKPTGFGGSIENAVITGQRLDMMGVKWLRCTFIRCTIVLYKDCPEIMLATHIDSCHFDSCSFVGDQEQVKLLLDRANQPKFS